MVESSQANPGSGFSAVSQCECETIGTNKKREKGGIFVSLFALHLKLSKKKIEVLPARVSAMT